MLIIFQFKIMFCFKKIAAVTAFFSKKSKVNTHNKSDVYE